MKFGVFYVSKSLKTEDIRIYFLYAQVCFCDSCVVLEY